IGGTDAMRDLVEELAALAGWSSITAMTSTTGSRRFTAAVINAGAQVMSHGGVRILVGADDAGVSADAVLTPVATGKDHSLRFGGRVLRFPASATPRVLAKMAGLVRR